MDSVIVPLFKEKGDTQDCGNFRGIKMISHTMKNWERIIDRRLREETSIGEEQFGFMPGSVIFFPTLVPGSSKQRPFSTN